MYTTGIKVTPSPFQPKVRCPTDHLYLSVYSHPLAHSFQVSRICAFVFLNILTPIVLAKSTPWYYSKIRAKTSHGDFVGSLYWTTAFTTFVYNVGYMANSVWNHIDKDLRTITSCVVHLSDQSSDCTIPASTTVYEDEVITLVDKVSMSSKCEMAPRFILRFFIVWKMCISAWFF